MAEFLGGCPQRSDHHCDEYRELNVMEMVIAAFVFGTVFYLFTKDVLSS
mgnify:CR=1